MTGAHLTKRTLVVKDLWIKEYERERRGKLISVLPVTIGYCVGFWSGSIGHTILFLIWTILVSWSIWLGLRFLREAYKINI
jgi:hypothetical protein